jgi:7-carboxy-7-deazaguanine synthase
VACDLMSVSPKLASSTPSSERDARWHRRHERTRHAPDVIRRLVGEYPYQMKFVADSPVDCRDVEAYLEEFPEIDRGRVMLMPQGTTLDELAARTRWLEPYCQAHALHFCPRRHIEWFGLARGT